VYERLYKLRNFFVFNQIFMAVFGQSATALKRILKSNDEFPAGRNHIFLHVFFNLSFCTNHHQRGFTGRHIVCKQGFGVSNSLQIAIVRRKKTGEF